MKKKEQPILTKKQKAFFRKLKWKTLRKGELSDNLAAETIAGGRKW